MIKQILLDLDGVLCDFVGESLALHGRRDLVDNWPKGQWDIAEVLGIPMEAFWDKINSAGIDWWANLPEYPWAKDLYVLCKSFGPVCVSTSPGRHYSSSAGKIVWIQKFFGEKFRAYMLGPHKYLFAQPGYVLVDDSDDNITAFVKHGGQGALVPQPWNKSDNSNILEVVEKRLIELSQ